MRNYTKERAQNSLSNEQAEEIYEIYKQAEKYENKNVCCFVVMKK